MANKSKYDNDVEHSRAVTNNANNIRNAAEVAKKIDVPEVKVAGTAVSALDKATGGKSTEFVAEGFTKVVEKTPLGDKVQDKLNKLNESGAGDLAGKLASAKSSADNNNLEDISKNKNSEKDGKNNNSNDKPSNDKDGKSNDQKGRGNGNRNNPNDRRPINRRRSKSSNDLRNSKKNKKTNLDNARGNANKNDNVEGQKNIPNNERDNAKGNANTGGTPDGSVDEKNKKKYKAKGIKKIIKTIMSIIGVVLGCLFVIVFIFFIIILVIISAVTGFLAADDDTEETYGTGECGFTISATSLSKEEFVKYVGDYSSSNDINKNFVDHAGDIYDKSVSKSVNPELVIIRAIAEGGATKTTGSNNYWGIGCSNTGGGKDCKSYSTFMDGVDGYLDVVSKYDSVDNMMKKYSYLGDYWYNPGGSDVGGCYYAKYIYDTVPTRVSNACASDKKCNGNKCVKTTDDEKEAYTTWQVNNMTSIREKVFGLGANEGVPCTGGGDGNFTPLDSYNMKHKDLHILSNTLPDAEITNINNFVNSQVQAAGYGTGAGVAAAGQSLVHALAQKGKYLGYCWGGDRTSLGFGKSWGKRSDNCGSPKNSNHKYYGMDCSGFVSWSIRNGCKSNFGSSNASGFRSYGSGISIKDAKPGDLMASSSHVRLIVKNNGNSIIVAEESSGADGLIFAEYSSAGSFKIVSMSNWYAKNCKKQ